MASTAGGRPRGRVRRPHVTGPSRRGSNTLRSVAAAVLALAAVALAGCGGADDAPDDGRVGIANPASVNCIELGGALEIVDGPTGQTGWCTLPDGRRVEEWELYRETHDGVETDE